MGASLGLFSEPNELVLDGAWAVAAGVAPAATGGDAPAAGAAAGGLAVPFAPDAATAGDPAAGAAAGDPAGLAALAAGDADAAGAAFSSSNGVRCPMLDRSGPVLIFPSSTGR
jgi:hypothetical protein